MEINWLSYAYREVDGYGRFANRLIAALERAGHTIYPHFAECTNTPDWIQARWGIDWDRFTISCLPFYYLQKLPDKTRHWVITMTEGSELPNGWAGICNEVAPERVITPCEYNATSMRVAGIKAPIHVLAGGTDPEEFPVLPGQRSNRPCTFLALADRGARKGWVEVWDAFYRAFGSASDTPDVRLIIKSRPEGNEMLDVIAKADSLDPRITLLMADMDMREVYASVDCFAIPSRSEGWGMPQREAAMMGLPVLVQQYGGVDDGHTHEWAIVVGGGKLEKIPPAFTHIQGEWMRADIDELARAMRLCYDCPSVMAGRGQRAAQWLREHQTWDHSAAKLIALMEEYGTGRYPTD